MIAKEAQLLTLLEGSKQFEVPIYQRPYSWSDEDRRELWQDLLRAGRTPKQNAHFMGSVVYIQPSTGMGMNVVRARLIDGQQRVTTVTLLLIALVERLRETGDLVLHFENEDGEENTETIKADWVLDSYLLNPTVSGDARYKLVLTYADKTTLMHHLGNVPLPEKPSKNVQAGLKFFREALRAPGINVQEVFLGLRKLQVVDVTLEQDKDNPQLIFESLNSTGLELAQTDLIRNNVLMDLKGKDQKELYEHHWLPMEQLFGSEYQDTLDRFMRDFLTLRTRAIPNQRNVYKDFKKYRAEKGQKVQALVEDLSVNAKRYADLVDPSRVENPNVRQALQDIAALEVRVSHPFLLEVLGDYAADVLSSEDLLRVLRLIEAFVMRRAVCGLATAPLNKFFSTLSGSLDKADYVASLERALVLMKSQGQDGFPSDQTFEEALVNQPLYQRSVCRQVLLRLERDLAGKEQVVSSTLTIEHVLPQNEKLSSAWRELLGEHWQDVQSRLVHTLGNLTLTGYNSELGDRPFHVKQTLTSPTLGSPQGYQESNLRMTRELAKEPTWNEAAILSRARRLARQAVGLWVRPEVSGEELQELRADKKDSGSYTVDWHLEGSSSALRDLFEQLRARLRALDLTVREEPRKVYVAYKLATNFCDVAVFPGLDALKIWLNLPYGELNDPLGLSQDVSNTGHHGNGEVELKIKPGVDLDSVMLLVQQGFAFQQARQVDTVAPASEGMASKLAALTGELRQVWEELELQLHALGADVSQKVNQGYVSFRRKQSFAEIEVLKTSIYIRVKFGEKPPEGDDLMTANWTSTRWPGWWKCNMATVADLEAILSALRRAYERQGVPSQGEVQTPGESA